MEAVTVDTRALIDKVLARYSSEFPVLRELLQNSDDAGCDTAEIRFETAESLGQNSEINTGPPTLPDLKTTDVVQWSFRNHGRPFSPEDWRRLPKIAFGNPDPQKVGAFGVGFYSIFSLTEAPCVSSGGKEMKFFWDKDDQLLYKQSDLSESEAKDLWTTFKMPLRKVAPMPPVLELIRFLSTSITFMIDKSLGQSQPIPIVADLMRLSPKKTMTINLVQHSPITINARTILDRQSSMQIREEKVELSVYTAEVEVTVDENLSIELNRCTKKKPPSCLRYSLIYTEKDQYDQSCIDERKYPRELPSLFHGLRADLHRGTLAKIFIGHATAQTTGIGGHMASWFIPTVERESIDLVDRDVAIWNGELLYVGGFLCRTVYEWELSRIQNLWEDAAAGEPCSTQWSQDRFHSRFLHILKFFTFHHSTPSSKVSQLLAQSFFGCSPLPLRLLSSVGVRRTPDIKAFDSVFSKFLRSLPMLSSSVTQDGRDFIAALPDQQKLPAITLLDVLRCLRSHTLDVEELVACLHWWIQRQDVTSTASDLLDAITFRVTDRMIHLSSIIYFIDTTVLGSHIPPGGPLPPSLIPLSVSKNFTREELASFGWQEFTIVLWLQHISSPHVMSVDERYDFTRSVDWASRVLVTVSRVWPQLSGNMCSQLRGVFKNMPCIPTSKGFRCPESSYLPFTDNTLYQIKVPIVDCDFTVDENMKAFLSFIGVRKNVPVQVLLHQMLERGKWTMFDLIDYLIQEEPSLTLEDLSILERSKIFMRENGEENTCRYRANELYPPDNIFRKLRLPVIKWNIKLEWRNSSSEAQLLHRLGLNDFPPLPKLVELCSSTDTGIQETAFTYLHRKLHSQYSHYKPENFCDVEFIPAESKGRTCLKRLGEVYLGTQWEALGLYVVQRRYLNCSIPWDQLGITRHPPTSKLLDLLENTPPLDDQTARRWFEVLFQINFSLPDLKKLSGLPIVPIGSSTPPKLLPPTRCYIDQSAKPKFYEKLFAFVDFNTKANRFLAACGSKNKVSIEDLAEALIENPERFFELAGGYEGFLTELRKLAYHYREISNDTLHQMGQKPSLLGLQPKKMAEGHSGSDYDYKFLTCREVIIVDDINDYQIFGHCLFAAPQEEVLERFYALLGCSYLSAVVTEECNTLRETPAVKTCTAVQSLILERLPLFIRTYTDTKPQLAIPRSADHLKVKASKKISVSKTLVTKNINQMKEVWATAIPRSGCIELWISTTANRDMYDVATSLCRLLFGTTKLNATLLLETMLSADLEALGRRGLLVDKIPLRPANEAEKRHSKTSMSTTFPPQRSMLDIQSSSQLLGSTEETLLLTCLPHTTSADDVKTCEIANVPSDKSSDTIIYSALPSSRMTHEVIPQVDIRNNVEKAIQACGSGGGASSIVHSEEKQFLSSIFCGMTAADIKNLRPIDHLKNIQVCVDEGIPDPNTFMKRMSGPLTRFVDIVITLSEVYRISVTTLRIFYDASGGCIAFNCRGTIYLNLRYFEVWHDHQVQSGNKQNAQMFWFLAIAHEIAHNLTDQHDADHEFWFSAICEARLGALSQSLQPVNTWPHYVLSLMIIANVVLFAYLTNCIPRVALS